MEELPASADAADFTGSCIAHGGVLVAQSALVILPEKFREIPVIDNIPRQVIVFLKLTVHGMIGMRLGFL
jgi:hypothetical protein